MSAAAYLVFSIRWHEGRYHGTGEWPPAPARLFQALVAASGIGGPIQPDHVAALDRLAGLGTGPVIAAPRATCGQTVGNFVPNNDLDAMGGDPRRIGGIRTKKEIRPRLFDAEIPLHYAWPVSDGGLSESDCRSLREIGECLYQLGKGIDFAWATVELVGVEDFDQILGTHAGTIHRPTGGAVGGSILACPMAGSLASLERRYSANEDRFEVVRSGARVERYFRQAPKARFRHVAYNCPPSEKLFEISALGTADRLFRWPLAHAGQLVETCRDGVIARLNAAFPDRKSEIDHWLMGRRADVGGSGSPAERIRILPIPSFGSRHVDLQIRRILVQIPQGSPLQAQDVFWAFDGLRLPDAVDGLVLAAANEHSMLRHFRPEGGSQVWQTLTPAALPELARRRRIDPKRRNEESKVGMEKRLEQEVAASAVRTALRHANVRTRVVGVCVQREPFHAQGDRSDAFAASTRFSKHRLWHVRIEFEAACRGVLAIGDGRFCGLGLMVPLR
ncbi:MAG: type I-U CRISPR-associated protein Csb2 [Chthoniobacterales bacterium]